MGVSTVDDLANGIVYVPIDLEGEYFAKKGPGKACFPKGLKGG